MKLFFAKILPLLICVALLVTGFLILLDSTNMNQPILILGGFMFLFGTWGSAITVDSFFEKSSKKTNPSH